MAILQVSPLGAGSITSGMLASGAALANLAAGSVTNDKLASPTAGVYRCIHASGGGFTAAGASGTTYFFLPNNVNSTGPNATNSNSSLASFLQFTAADFAVTGLTTKMFIRAQIAVGATAPAVTITVGLYPVTISTSTYAAGTVTTGSTIAFTSPGSSAFTTGSAADFTIPADGNYVLGYTLSGTPSGSCTLYGQVYVRNV